jgi:hypothetical protein
MTDQNESQTEYTGGLADEDVPFDESKDSSNSGGSPKGGRLWTLAGIITGELDKDLHQRRVCLLFAQCNM